jgi:C4-type Zn-finger protein
MEFKIMSLYIDKRPISTIENKIECPQCASIKVYPKKNWYRYPNKKPKFIILWQCKTCNHQYDYNDLEEQ